ncbi:MAG TPA: energy transducer TonB [Bacteroidia bacterium]
MQKKKSPILDLNKDRLIFRILGFAFTFALLILVFSFTTFEKRKSIATIAPVSSDKIETIILEKEKPEEKLKPTPPLSQTEIEKVADDEEFKEPNLDDVFDPSITPEIIYEFYPNESKDEINDEIIEDPKILEVQIAFKGGDEAFSQFISDNLVYPPYHEAEGNEGVVWVNFVVDKDGSVINVYTEGEVDMEFAEEAKRVIKMTSGMWLPAEYKKKRVKSRIKMSIAFEIK